MDNAWKDKLRERFSDYSVPEPEGLWEGIEEELARNGRKPVFPVWWVTGGVAAAAAAVALFLLLPGTGRLAPESAREAVASVGAAGEPATPEEAIPEVIPETEPVPAPRTVTVLSRRTLLAEAEPDTGTVPLDATETVPDHVAEIVVLDSQPSEKEEVTPKDTPKDMPKDTPSDEFWITQDPVQVSVRKVRPVSLNLYRQSGEASLAQSSGFGLTHTGNPPTRASYDGTSAGLVKMLSANRASTYEARHAAPARVGLLVAVPVSDHLSLVSGLNWTTLTSEFEESTASTRNLVQQNLGYLGVPLRLEASYNPWKNLWFHVGAGGMMEQNVRARTETTTFIGNQLQTQSTGRVDARGTLWSLGASAGAEYRFLKQLGFFVAPGLEYHFDNGSSVSSAYTEHKAQWSLTLGLRLSFDR